MRKNVIGVLLALLAVCVSAQAASVVKSDTDLCPSGMQKFFVSYSTYQHTDSTFVCAPPLAHKSAKGIVEIQESLRKFIGYRWFAIILLMPLDE